LADFADRREQARSIIAEAAIASLLSPDADERPEAAITKRLHGSTATSRLEGDIGIANEASPFSFAHGSLRPSRCPKRPKQPPAPRPEERYDKFLEALGRRLVRARGLGRK
jgi:hypothetical protein